MNLFQLEKLRSPMVIAAPLRIRAAFSNGWNDFEILSQWKEINDEEVSCSCAVRTVSYPLRK